MTSQPLLSSPAESRRSPVPWLGSPVPAPSRTSTRRPHLNASRRTPGLASPRSPTSRATVSACDIASRSERVGCDRCGPAAAHEPGRALGPVRGLRSEPRKDACHCDGRRRCGWATMPGCAVAVPASPAYRLDIQTAIFTHSANRCPGCRNRSQSGAVGRCGAVFGLLKRESMSGPSRSWVDVYSEGWLNG